jgi:hypothetical protein
MIKGIKEIFQNIAIFAFIMFFLISATVSTTEVTVVKPSLPKSQKVIFIYHAGANYTINEDILQSRIYPYLRSGYIVSQMSGDSHGTTVYLIKY